MGEKKLKIGFQPMVGAAKSWMYTYPIITASSKKLRLLEKVRPVTVQ
jgi:hypothetical protein